MKSQKLIVKGSGISVMHIEKEDYISLTDIAKSRNTNEPFAIINNWMHNRSAIEFIGL